MNIISINKFKALWKGYIVRKRMLQTRKQYEDIFYDIQGTDGFELTWQGKYLCLPHMKEKRDEELGENKVSNLINADVSCQTSIVQCNDTPKNNQEDDFNDVMVGTEKCDVISPVKCRNVGFTQIDKDIKFIKQDFLPSSIVDKNDLRSSNDLNDLQSSISFSSDQIILPFYNCEKNILTESWLSDKSFASCKVESVTSQLSIKTPFELNKMKEDLLLELMWINQAISSRKTYLTLK